MIGVKELGLDLGTTLPSSIKENISGFPRYRPVSQKGWRLMRQLYRVLRQVDQILDDGDINLLRCEVAADVGFLISRRDASAPAHPIPSHPDTSHQETD